MEDQELTRKAIRDIVFMECIGIKPIIVHGGGKAITAKLKEQNIKTHFINGLRFTCEKTIKVVDDVLHNNVNKNIVETVKTLNGKAVSLSGKEILQASKMFTTDKTTGKKLDIGYVGDIDRVFIHRVLDIINDDVIPVITPLACDSDGNTYNINADIAAAKITEMIQARKLVFISDVPGLLRDTKDENSRISTVMIEEIEKYIEDGIIAGGMIPKVESAVRAITAGTNKVHFIDGRMKHSLLLEMFTDSGVGTQIVKDIKSLNNSY